MMNEDKNPWADDCLERKRFGELLLACLQGEAAFTEEAFVVALTGKFGAGKSHFLRMWRDDLDLKAKGSPETYPRVVTVNAWESDFSGEPLLALVSEISSQLTGTKKDKAADELKRGVAGFIGGARRIMFDAAAGYVDDKTGIELEGVVDAVRDGSSGGDLERRGRKLFSDFAARKKSLEGLRVSLGKFIASRSNVQNDAELKLVLIVDELDRCHPRYAIEFLEAIKHVFNVKGLAVVLGVDWDQLGCTARALFGGRLDVDEYFRKFIKRRIELPQSSSRSIERLTHKSIAKYFNSDSGIWKSIESIDQNAFRFFHATFQALNLTPRQIESAAHLFASFLHLDCRYTGFHSGRHHYKIEFFIASAQISHPAIVKAIARKEENLMILKRLRKLNLAKRYSQSGLNGDAIEGYILGSLKTNENYHDFVELVGDAGYNTAETIEVNGRSIHNEFLHRIKTAHGYDESICVQIARNMMELDMID